MKTSRWSIRVFDKKWNDRMIAAIVAAESAFPHKHLIATGTAVRSAKIDKPNSSISIFNFHAATSDAVRLNYALNKVIADDETGGKGIADTPYRKEAWEFILAGGGVFSHLDFSFTCEHPDGTAKLTGEPGGGGPEIREQLHVLKQFIERFDFVRMKPADEIVQGGRITAAQQEESLDVKAATRVLAQRGKVYAIFVGGGTQAELLLELPAGTFKAQWINTKSGAIVKEEFFSHSGGNKRLASSAYEDDIALGLTTANR